MWRQKAANKCHRIVVYYSEKCFLRGIVFLWDFTGAEGIKHSSVFMN